MKSRSFNNFLTILIFLLIFLQKETKPQKNLLREDFHPFKFNSNFNLRKDTILNSIEHTFIKSFGITLYIYTSSFSPYFFYVFYVIETDICFEQLVLQKIRKWQGSD